MDMVVEIDGDGSEGTSPSWQGAETETFCPSNLPFGGGGAVEHFGIGRLLQAKEARSVECQGAHTTWWRGQG